MKRRNFLKNLLSVTAVGVIAPSLALTSIKPVMSIETSEMTITLPRPNPERFRTFIRADKFPLDTLLENIPTK